jgi:hypothetical protein
MAEVKNAFIKSKMNQDLDDRLIPSGEYREGINIQVSKSEGADVGALQNVLGNKKAVDFRVITGVNDLVTIGQFTDATNNVIYVFLTNYTDPNPSFQPTYSSSAKNFIYSYNVLNGDTAKLVEGSFLNFSTTNTVYGVNILENLLFWTDNRNQPRKINITSATQVPGYYTTEDQISVAKLNPYEPIELYREVNSIWETTMLDKTSLLLPDGVTANPNYDAQYAGDPDFLEDKFVRFSYRYIFDDGEHSIIAPFTQPAFIPKQDGYFLAEDTNVSGNTEAENAAYRSTIVEFMENKVDNILLQIPLPTIGSNTFNDFKITEIEILYKESDQIAVQVVDVITQEEIKETTTSVFEYNYQARKPFRTLPDSDIIRVYDKIPVRALGQEIISNRIVYSNFQDKHTPPEYLDYNVGAFNKSSFNVTSGNISTNTTSIVEYPTHTIKQNRNYQVGVVLSDKYGRSSSTILSIVNDGDIGGASGSFGGSTYYHPYKDSTNNAPATWPGDALKVLFNSIIPNNPADLQTGWPGLYNGTSNSSNYNPLGWYSYKIVVKQTEQDYYNVYLPGILNEDPGGSLDDSKNTVAYITLLNDNINKVPRDLSEVGPNQKQYRSSVQLFGRVTPDNILAGGPTFNEQYYPGRESHTVSTIGEEDDLLGSVTNYVDIYQSASNPSLARLTQSNLANPIGANVHSGGNYNILLGIYETNPEESRLDIFWETSTTGLISDLNEAIATGTNQATGLDLWNFSQSEADPIGTAVTGEFAPLDITDQPINSSVVTLNSVVDGTGTPRSGWELVEVPGTPNRWYLKTTSNFYYGVNGSTKESYTFTLGVVGGGINSTLTATGSLTNVAPTITPCNASTSVQQGETTVATFTGVNGSIVAGNKQTENLTWELVSTTPSLNTLSINPTTGVMTESSGEASGVTSAVVKLSDAGGLSTTCTTNIVFGEDPANCGFNNTIFSYIPSVIATKNQAYGIYWVSNKTNASANEPISRNQGGLALELDNNLVESYKETELEGPSNCKSIGGFSSGVMRNSNYNAKDKVNCDQEDCDLSAGTGFISVDFLLYQYSFNSSNANDTLNLKWPAYLQYRSVADSIAGNDNWVQAVDVEGIPIAFGGQQKSDYPAILPNDTNSVSNKGILLNTTETSSLNLQGTPEGSSNTLFSTDVANVFLQAKTSQYSANLSAKSNRTFAIGKDQGYGSTPDKFGDYRLIIGFPYGTASNGSQSIPITVTGTVIDQGICPPSGSIYHSTEMFSGKYQTQITFGDFYYPSAYGTATSFSYWISNGQSSRTTAQNTQPIATEVYAREWHFKYITQLYKDPNLTIPLTTANGLNQTAGGFHSYCAATDGSINSEYGNSNSHTNGIGQTTTSTYTDQDRRWTAQFDSNGKKIKQTAQPNRKNQ